MKNIHYNPNIGGPLDKPIIDILEMFNALGLTTKGSCAGYPFPGHGSGYAFSVPGSNSRPFIWFEERVLSEDKVNLLARIVSGTKFVMPYGRHDTNFSRPSQFLGTIELSKSMSTSEKISQWELLRHNLKQISGSNDFWNQW